MGQRRSSSVKSDVMLLLLFLAFFGFKFWIWTNNDLYVDDAAMAVDTPMSMPMPMILDA